MTLISMPEAVFQVGECLNGQKYHIQLMTFPFHTIESVHEVNEALHSITSYLLTHTY